jgi:HNH endonuclease
MNKLLMIKAAPLAGFAAVGRDQPAFTLIAVSAACAIAALAWLIWHHIAFRRLRSLHGLPIAPPRPPQRQGRKVTVAEVRRMFRNQYGLCNNPYCRADLRRTRYEVDHIVARSRGGPDGPANAQLLCRNCNQMKCVQPWSAFLVEYQEKRVRRMEPRREEHNGVTYFPPR